MGRTILGMFLGLVIASVGLYWWQGQAAVELNAPSPPLVEQGPSPDELPLVDPKDLQGPEPPKASALTREEIRFFRYDRNRDRFITRNEMLSTRSDAFRELDTDGNNLLTFEEWAVTTVRKFDSADINDDRKLTPAEFAATAPRKSSSRKPSCRC